MVNHTVNHEQRNAILVPHIWNKSTTSLNLGIVCENSIKWQDS